MEPAVPLIQVTQELEALKLRLASMEPDALNLEDNAAMAQEISAIRLQLQRLRLDHEAIREAVRMLDEPLSRGSEELPPLPPNRHWR